MALSYIEPEMDLAGRLPEGAALEMVAPNEYENEHPLEPQEDVLIYNPSPGTLIEDKEPRALEKGTLYIGSYHSERASHRVGIYKPVDYEPESKKPVILMTTPLGTGAKGHNAKVAEEMMNQGFLVICKGPPRYPGPTVKALTLAEDTNEMFGVLNQAQVNGLVGKVEEIWSYGESQGAMKGLCALAIAQSYGYNVTNALQVDPCYFRRINLSRPDKQMVRGLSAALGIVTAAKEYRLSDLPKLRGTFDLKDVHHHVIVLPVLVGGETGTFIPRIPRDQDFSVRFFGKRGISKPLRSKAELEEHCENVSVTIDRRYGHVDGIMSQDLRVLREAMLFELARRHDMPSAA